jgi:hypothetical protein
VDLNVCPACGEWSDDFVVAADEAVLVCAACGQRRPFVRLPLLALTGPSGVGKSAVATILAGQLQQCVVLEQDICEDAELEARLRARPAWRGWTQEKLAPMLAFNQWVKDKAATTVPPMQLLDTGGRSVQDSAARVRAWVLQQLVASP